jgi:hypothetical protein
MNYSNLGYNESTSVDVRNYFIDDTDVVLLRSTKYKLIILAQQYRMVLYLTRC